jgi:hypothetical protein
MIPWGWSHSMHRLLTLKALMRTRGHLEPVITIMLPNEN